MATSTSTLEQYSNYLLSSYSNFPRGKYVSLFVIRKTESETIFRTEGSGEGLVKETVIAGINHTNTMRRVVISKRKQTAVERRAGREVLREHNLLRIADSGPNKGGVCTLNTNSPCGKCIDCMLYGFAVGGGGAQKSRVMTDDAYSLGPVSQVTGRRTFNATFDNGTMRLKDEKGGPDKISTSINEDEYVLPETHFLDIETLKDVTAGELQYVIANVLRSSRYGAISSRLGKIRNSLAAIVFSDTELFSNLELTQAVYDILLGDKEELDFPLLDRNIEAAVGVATEKLMGRLVSRTPVVLREETLQKIIDDTIGLYRDGDNVKALLERVEKGYKPNGK